MLTALLTALTVLWKSFLAFLRCFQRITISDPENHLVVITGCDSGFGLMTTQKLLKQNYYVVPLCLTEKGVVDLEEYCKSNGFTRCLPLRCDVTKEEDVKRVYGRVEELLKEKKGLKMWALINNAGIAPGGFLDWASMDTFRKPMEVNYFAIVLMTKTFLELLKRVKYSRIINISSIAGHTGFPHGCAYAGSKHAVEGLSKSLRQELYPWNIFVCNVNPSFMKTPLIATAFDLSMRDFNAAPKAITKQYPLSNIENTKETAAQLEEDPALVVDCIIKQLTVFSPVLNNFPGIGSKVLNWLLWMTPQSVKSAVEVGVVVAKGYGPYPEVVKTYQGEDN